MTVYKYAFEGVNFMFSTLIFVGSGQTVLEG